MHWKQSTTEKVVGGFYVEYKWYQIHVFFQPFGCLIVGN